MVTDEQIQAFTNALQEKLTAGRTLKVTIEAIPGRRYTKITEKMGSSGHSVYCFINNETGDVYKAASWKAPELNKARGNILGEDILKGCGVYGVDYLR